MQCQYSQKWLQVTQSLHSGLVSKLDVQRQWLVTTLTGLQAVLRASWLFSFFFPPFSKSVLPWKVFLNLKIAIAVNNYLILPRGIVSNGVEIMSGEVLTRHHWPCA
jgi:hypothetical protein